MDNVFKETRHNKEIQKKNEVLKIVLFYFLVRDNLYISIAALFA